MRLSKELQELFEQTRQAQAVADQMFSSEQGQVLLDQIAAAQIVMQQSGAIEAVNAVQAILKNTGLIEDTRPALPLAIQPEPTQPKKQRKRTFTMEQEVEIFTSWKASLLTQKAFAESHNIPLRSFEAIVKRRK